MGGQYLLIEPGANPVLYVTRRETEDKKPDGGSAGGIGSAILGIFSNLPVPEFISNLPFIPGSGTSETNATEEAPDKRPVSETPEKVRMSKPNGHHMTVIIYSVQILLSRYVKNIFVEFKRCTFRRNCGT